MEPKSADPILFQLVITRRKASEILLLPRGSGWALPQVAIAPGQRVAEQLTAEVRKAWKLETYCLLVPGPARDHPGEKSQCAVLESVTANDPAPADSYWAPRAAAARLLQESTAGLVQSVFDELETYLANEEEDPSRGRAGCGNSFCGPGNR